jgi:hypothetical protein
LPCFSPVEAWFHADGGRPSFHEKRGYDICKTLSCGVCKGCRATNRSSWALRGKLELVACGGVACFATRTYDDEHLPPDGGLDFRDSQLFYKRLRESIRPARIRYAGCEEYGPQTLRPHCHDLIFGYWPADAVPYSQYWTSEVLTRAWGKGRVLLRPVDAANVEYVMAHHVDKLTGDEADRAYSRVDPDTGEIVRLQSPKFYCSRRPGIGAPFLDRFLCDVSNPEFRGMLTRDGDIPLGHYLNRKVAERLPMVAVERETARQLAMLTPEFLADNTPERLTVREVCLLARIRRTRERSGGVL